MKNILIISPFRPYPLVSGGHQAIFNGISVLEGIANVYLSFDTTESKWKQGEGDEIGRVLPFVKTIPYITPESKHTIVWYCRILIKKLLAIFPRRKNSHHTADNRVAGVTGIEKISADKIKFILSLIKDLHIDIVQVETVVLVRLIDYLPSSVKTIFVHYELRYVRDELAAIALGKISPEVRELLERNKNEEIRLLNQYDHVVTLSDVDRNKLIDAGVTVPILSSFAIVQENDVENEEIPARKVLTFVGPEFHTPNIDGVMWFLNNCWNSLLEKDNEYTLQIIGNWSEEVSSFLSEHYKGVVCLGFVNNLSSAIGGTTMIVPLNIGSGIRMKILEAAQYRVPVVTTSVGVEGLPLVDGEHLFIADDPETFVEDIIRLQDTTLRNTFVNNTRKIISSKYSFDALKENRAGLYANID